MKHLFILLSFVGLAIGQTFNNSTNLDAVISKNVVRSSGAIGEFVVDVTLDTQDVAYSRPSDIIDLALAVTDDGTSTIGLSLVGGTITYSCYDILEESGDDSVNVEFTIQGSDYAVDGGRSPTKAKSDAWATIHNDTVLAVSNSGALAEGTRALVLPDQDVRYIRWQLTNLSTEDKNGDARCRVYWTRKARQR